MAAAAATNVDVECTDPCAHHAPSRTPGAESSAFSHRMSASTALIERMPIERLVLSDDRVKREARARIGRRRPAHRRPASLIAKYPDRGARHAIDVTDGAQHTGLAVVHHFTNAARIRRDDGRATRERLEGAEPERLVLAGQQEEVRAGEQRRDRVELAEEPDRRGDAE